MVLSFPQDILIGARGQLVTRCSSCFPHTLGARWRLGVGRRGQRNVHSRPLLLCLHYVYVPLPSRQPGFGVDNAGDGRPSVRVRLWEEVGIWRCPTCGCVLFPPNLPRTPIFTPGSPAEGSEGVFQFSFPWQLKLTVSPLTP